MPKRLPEKNNVGVALHSVTGQIIFCDGHIMYRVYCSKYVDSIWLM